MVSWCKKGAYDAQTSPNQSYLGQVGKHSLYIVTDTISDTLTLLCAHNVT